MLKVFIPEPIREARLVPFIADKPQSGNRLFQDLPEGVYAGMFERVSDIAHADLVILPHEYVVLRAHPKYLRQSLEHARAKGKKTLISAYQDSTEPIRLPETVVLRSSAYRSTLLENEIVMPAYIEDVGSLHGFAPHPKGETPTVGFMGQAGFRSVRQAARYYLRNTFLLHGAKRDGLYFRRHALTALERDPRIAFSGTVRKHFSGHRASIELPPEEARRAYVASIQDTLFTLAPRGDGNYSLRFYETISLGRIPILIDTDMPLPLENEVSYDSFMLRVPHEETARIATKVFEFWQNTSEAELTAMQIRARAAFETYLFMPAFLRKILTRERLRL